MLRLIATPLVMAGALLLAGGTPARAQLVVAPGCVAVTLAQGEAVEHAVTMTNTGAEPASFCLSFDRPLQRSGVLDHSERGGDACGEPGALLYSVTNVSARIGWQPYGLTMTPDGRLFAADYHHLQRTHELDAALNLVRSFTHPKVAELSAFVQTVGVAYNADTGTLWWTNAEVSGHDIRRVMLLEGDLGGPSGSETPLPTFGGLPNGGSADGNPLRSRVDPNGVLYITFGTFDTQGVAAVRPAPLAPSWLALSEWSGTLGPGESAEVGLTFSAGERAVGDYTASLQVIEAASGVVVEVPLTLTVTQGTAVEPGPEGDQPLALSVYPNPARGLAEVVVMLPEAGIAEVALYDVLGRQVALLHEGALAAGTHALALDVAGLPAGVYVVRVTAGSTVVSSTVTVLR